MSLEIGSRLLRGRYELAAGPWPGSGDVLSWQAFSDYGVRHLVKTWAYQGAEPDPVQRALWDAELRTLYKVGSSPGASETLVVLRDAGLDRDARCFVMVLEAPGYEPLGGVLPRRAQYPWLSNRDATARRELWSALGRIASGLHLLHGQQVLHRDVGVDALLFSDEEGSESLRLGGFEWSVRLGRPLEADPPLGWPTPPERASQSSSAWRPDDDWFGFGMMCARLLLDIESYANNAPDERHARVLRAVAATRQLTEGERDLIQRLIATDPLERLVRAYDAVARIRDVVRSLSTSAVVPEENRSYTVVVNLRQTSLVDYLLDMGLREHLALVGTQTFSPADPAHASGACTFVQRDLEDALLYAVPSQPFYLLVGRRLVLRVVPNTDRDGSKTWQMASCAGPGELRYSEGGTGCVPMPRGRIAVRSLAQVHRDRTIAQSSASWDDILPRIERGAELARDLSRFHEFIRATNQIELLLLDAEIFPYEVVAEPVVTEGWECVIVRERPREEDRRVLPFFEIEKGLIEFLQREQMAGKPDSGNVILSGPAQDALVLPSGGKDNQWRVTSVDLEQETARLERDAIDPDRPPPPQEGVLRSAGMPGQTRLIRRRKQAIDALDSHSYLLRSLAAPGQVYMDTGAADLPVQLDPDAVDAAKRASIEDILRVRPIYTLQGPPGTGKTTLVAWLLREILEDDPVAQVLVTAQAHGAVDVLRARVSDEAFRGVPPDRRPLAVRLGARRGEDAEPEDSVEQVALIVLRASIEGVEAANKRTLVQDRWLDDARAMADELARHEAMGSRAADFVELVKRGANLTYCTTSAAELEALAAGQSFDWSIVEEAGKAHGFDLALPLQAGHRWLLIGDHKQLPPYRFEDYLDGLDSLDLVVEALQGLPEAASGLLDWEWVTSWRDRTTAERREFRDYARDWLRTFKQAFAHASVVVGGGDAGEKITMEESDGAAAGMLVGQHRMHPDIGELISRTYYEDKLANRTVGPDGAPAPRVLHGFAAPEGIAGKAIVWADVPWCRDDARTREQGPYEGKPRYTNKAEVVALRAFLSRLGPERQSDSIDLAVLSPYNQQVSLLRGWLRGVELPGGLTLKRGLNARPATDGKFVGVHTVDSFQGNQADVVAVSLVRNNLEGPGRGMGFLDESSRLDVLLSRAERLLILVGSWDFFVHQVSTVELDDITHPLWHWKQIVTLLDAWFISGRALRTAADLRGLE